MKQFTFARIKS